MSKRKINTSKQFKAFLIQKRDQNVERFNRLYEFQENYLRTCAEESVLNNIEKMSAFTLKHNSTMEKPLIQEGAQRLCIHMNCTGDYLSTAATLLEKHLKEKEEGAPDLDLDGVLVDVELIKAKRSFKEGLPDWKSPRDFRKSASVNPVGVEKAIETVCKRRIDKDDLPDSQETARKKRRRIYRAPGS